MHLTYKKADKDHLKPYPFQQAKKRSNKSISRLGLREQLCPAASVARPKDV